MREMTGRKSEKCLHKLGKWEKGTKKNMEKGYLIVCCSRSSLIKRSRALESHIKIH